MDSLCLQVAQMPRSRDLAIFMLIDNRQIKPIALPLAARAHRVITFRTLLFAGTKFSEISDLPNFR